MILTNVMKCFLSIFNENERNTMNSIKIYRTEELCKRLSISKSTLYRLRISGNFPASIQLSVNAVGWSESDIEEWLKNSHNQYQKN